MIFEHKLLQDRGRPRDPYRVPIGKARSVAKGRDVTIAATSTSIRAMSAAERLADKGIEAEVIDLRTIRPIDTATLIQDACETGRLLTVYEAVRRPLGIGAGSDVPRSRKAKPSISSATHRSPGLGGGEVPLPYNPTLEIRRAAGRRHRQRRAAVGVREEGLMAAEVLATRRHGNGRQRRPGKIVGEPPPSRKAIYYFELETDESTMEVDAPASGIIAGISVLENVEVPVGTVVARIYAEGEAIPEKGAERGRKARGAQGCR